jgi:hypothetical protein
VCFHYSFSEFSFCAGNVHVFGPVTASVLVPVSGAAGAAADFGQRLTCSPLCHPESGAIKEESRCLYLLSLT